jgi:hypothetical protein
LHKENVFIGVWQGADPVGPVPGTGYSSRVGGHHDPLVPGRIVIRQLSCFLPLVGDRLRSLGKYAGKAPILLFYSMGKIGVLLINVMNIHLID